MIAHRASATSAALAGLLIFGAPAASAQGVQLFAVLSGGNEVSPTGQAAAGDPDGYGAATGIGVAADRLCFSILVNGLDQPIAAHVHEEVAGRNGPIVIPLAPPATGNPGHASGCVAVTDPALLQRIRETPSRFYVNVHTAVFPAGAVRGQLF
jgi:hypothetical protein